VINNLLSNAIRYTPSGFVKMRTYQAGNWICLEVADSGMGIDPEDVPHLFDRFYRGRNVSQSKLVGTGLGLAIVKEIVDIHDGVVELDSQVGNGSIFKVKFPSPQLNVSDNQGESTNLTI
jgi:signal transduction histidine kinase